MPLSAESLLWIALSGAGTVVGGAATLALRSPSARTIAALLGFTGGVMFAAAVFSLLVPALESGSLGEVVGGFLLGATLLAVLDHFVPHLHARFAERDHADDPRRHRATLLLSALTIHNLPEGLSVGLAFAAGGPTLGVPIALAIGIQNVPEGFAAAAPLVESGTSRRRAALLAALTGLVEPPAALLAVAAFGLVAVALPAGLAFAAGAMVYVVIDELIPESHAGGHEREASLAFLGGFGLMLALDNAF